MKIEQMGSHEVPRVGSLNPYSNGMKIEQVRRCGQIPQCVS